MSRVGNAILNFGLSQNFYALTLGDNSLKVVRVDNNKVALHAQSLNLA